MGYRIINIDNEGVAMECQRCGVYWAGESFTLDRLLRIAVKHDERHRKLGALVRKRENHDLSQ